jgi:hypothetical protein
MRMRASTVLIVVLAGEVGLIADGHLRRLSWGDATVIPHDLTWELRPQHGPARLVIAAAPAGPERVVAALCHHPPTDGRNHLELATEHGVELLV